MRTENKTKKILILLLSALLFSGIPTPLSGRKSSSLKIIDYQKYLNRKFKKVKRKDTRFIIIHTSEAGKISTLRTLSGGKRVGRRRTRGGHANYAITREGKVYRILNHKYRADHSGRSMWNGITDLSSHSIGIELVGYHYGTITFEQYRSLTPLLKELQRIYHIPDRNILTHSQVSYGRPNFWYKHNHRGRKRCALNFNRSRAGLIERWTYDPDVKAGRLTSDYQTRKVFYSSYSDKMVRISPEKREVIGISKREQTRKREEMVQTSNIISRENTAWNIAGEDYKDPETVYILPNGKKIAGDQVGVRVGWGNIPRGTRVVLNQFEEEKPDNGGPIHVIGGSFTAWSYAGKDYRKNTTFYFLPGGKVKSGTRIKDWDSLPPGVKMIVGYTGPYPLGSTTGKTAWGIAGRKYNSRETVYLIPGTGVVTGDRMKSFTNLPKYSKIFLKRR